MAMRALTAMELAATAAERWHRQYADYDADWRFYDGTTKGSVEEALKAAPRHTPEVIAEIINPGWAYPKCDVCSKDKWVVVNYARDFSDETHSICLDCLRTATTMAEQFGPVGAHE